MNLSPETLPATSVETRNRPAPPSHRCIEIDEKIAAADFQNLLDAPVLSAEERTRLTKSVDDPSTQETSIEACAWLALNSAGLIPAAEAEAVSAASSAAQTPVSRLELELDSPAPTLASNEILLSPTPLEPEITPPVITSTSEAKSQADSAPASSVFSAHITQMLANNALPMALNPASPPVFSSAQAGAANPSLPIPNVQHPDFEQGMATHLRWCADHTIGQAHIRINPPHLGAIEVQLHLRDQHVHAAFFSPHTEVCQRLQESLPVLQQLLDEHGLHLAQADVNQQALDSNAHTHTAKTAPLSSAEENVTEENKALEPTHHRQTTLLDTWA